MFHLKITSSGISEGQTVLGSDINTGYGELEHYGNRLSIIAVGKAEQDELKFPDDLERLRARVHPAEMESAFFYAIPETGQIKDYPINSTAFTVERLQ